MANAAAIDDLKDGAIGCVSIEHAADPDLDAEVARFLELEFFAHVNNSNGDIDSDDAAVGGSAFQLSAANKANSALFVKEDAGFLDLIGSFDLPDLEFSGIGELSLDGSAQMRDEAVKPTPVTTTQDLQSTSSLHVQIPASALSPAPLPTKATTTKTGPPPAVQPAKKVRKRVKDEIEYLRQQVVDFEEKLEKLQQAAREEEQVASQTESLSFRQGQFSSQAALWEHVAKRQADEKEKSQAENAKLREKLSKHLVLARSLSNLLNTQHDVSWMEQSSEGRVSKKLCATPDDDEIVFEMLEVTVDALYCELNAAPDDEAEHAELEPGVKSDASGNVFIEYADCNILPFDFRTVASVMWKLVSTTSMNLGNRQYQAFSATENTTRARLTTKLRLRRQDKLVKMSCVGKRFVTEDRVIIVWAMMNQTQDGYLLLNGKDRVRVRESGWIILKGATTAPGRPQARTIIQSISRLTPVLERSDDSAAASVNDHVGMLTDVVLGLYHQNLSFLRQMTENSILSDEVAKQSS